MSSIARKITVAATMLAAIALSIPQARSADMRLEGEGYYKLTDRSKFFQEGVEQSGRYRNLGRDFYRQVEYGIDFIGNDSDKRSGSLSYELWALPFYGSTSGIILMTRGIQSIPGRSSIDGVVRTGYGVSLNKRRFPEQSLWEYTRKGWKFRDALSFTSKAEF